MLRPWRRQSTSIVHHNPWWKVRRDIARLPSGAEAEYYSVETPGSVMIIPIDAAGCFILVGQYRFLNDRESLEFPGGGIRAGQSAGEAAAAELAEEAGCAAGLLRSIGSFNPFNGVTGELCEVFVAEGLSHTAAHPDVTEEFVVRSLSEDAFDRAVADGTIWDGMTLAAHRIFEAWRAAEGGRQ